MKRHAWLGAVVFATIGLAGGLVLHGRAQSSDAAQEAGAPMERLLLGVEKVTCGSCEGRIRAALEARSGVRAVAVDLAQRTVTVEYVRGSDDPKALADAVTRIGYPARFLAAGSGVAPATPTAARSRGGCGGNCCAGG